MLDALKKRMEAAAAKVEASIPTFEGIKVSDEQREERYAICKECEHLFKATSSCKKCGCFMALKTYVAQAECPIGKWLPIKIVHTDK